MRRPKRPSLFWLVALLLLWQQMALATALCPDSAPVMAAGVAWTAKSDCVGRMHGQAGHLPCASHGEQGAVVRSEARSPQVPGLLLPPLAPTMSVIASLPLANASLAFAFPRHGYIPPRRLLYCSLLI